jgi:V8-like Glu-specific endopeptidase
MARWLTSRRNRWTGPLGIGILLTFGSACAVGDFVDPTETSSPGELLNGSPTFDRPEVGRLHFGQGGFCTATLITENVAVTAAHCVSYGTQQTAGNYGRFVVDPDENASPRSFDITHYRSFSSRLGWSDVALLRLATRVPASVAIPTTVSARSASSGQSVTVYGYGCTDRDAQRGGFLKRSFTYAFGRSENLCPGDSGGPVVVGDDGPVFLVNSGYYTQSGTDIFGEPWRLKADVDTQISNWVRDVGMPAAPAEVRLTNSSGAPLWARCNGTESAECTGWTYLRDGATEGIVTQGRRIILDNQDYHPTLRWSHNELVAPTDDVTVHPNQDDPFTPLVTEPDPEPEPDVDPEPDPNTGGDDDPIVIQGCMGGDTRGGALAIEGAVRGEVCENRQTWLQIDLQAGDKLKVDVSFTHQSGDIDATLYAPNQAEVGRSAGTTDRESIEHTAASDGPYHLLVYGYRSASNTVTVALDIVTTDTEDVCAADGNDAREDATALAGPVDGRVCDGDTDWLKIEQEGPWTVLVEFNHSDGDLDVRGYGPGGRRTGQSAGTSDQERITGNGPGFVEVFGYNGAQNAYTVRFE